MESEVTPKEVIRVLEGCINFLNIEVMAVDLPSSVSMELEEKVEKMKELMTKLEKMEKFATRSTAPVTKSRTSSQRMNTELKVASSKVSSTIQEKSENLKAMSSKVSTKLHNKTDDLKAMSSKVSTKLHNKTEDIKAEVVRRLSTRKSGRYRAMNENQNTCTKEENDNDSVDSNVPPNSVDTEIIEENTYEPFDDVKPPEPPASRLRPEETGDEVSISSSDTQEDKLKTMLGCSADELKLRALFHGLLRKHKKSRFSIAWDKRLCILCDDLLFYYKPENDKKPLGVIELTGYKLVAPPKSNGYVFNLEGSDKSRPNYCFQADSLNDAECWKKHLSSVIENDKTDGIDNASFVVTSLADTNSLSTSGESSDTSGGARVVDIIEEIYDDVKEGEEGKKNEMNGYIPTEDEEQDVYDDVRNEEKPQGIPEEGVTQDETYDDIGQSMKQTPPTPAVRQISPRPTTMSPPTVVPEFLPPIHPRAPSQHPPVLPPPIPTDQGFSIDNIYMGMYDCEAEDNQDLAFKRGDILYILEKIDTQWWLAFLEGKVGLVPSNHLTTAFVG